MCRVFFSIRIFGGDLTDILIYLCAIANRYGIDLESAFREKERRIETRTWD